MKKIRKCKAIFGEISRSVVLLLRKWRKTSISTVVVHCLCVGCYINSRFFSLKTHLSLKLSLLEKLKVNFLEEKNANFLEPKILKEIKVSFLEMKSRQKLKVIFLGKKGEFLR
jgi:hypothetical protein